MASLKKNIDRVNKKVASINKQFVQTLKKNSPNKKVLFVIGCQRSGTNMVLEIFERDYEAKVYGEFSKLSSDDKHKIRLNSFEKVKNEIEKVSAGFIVLKPLVESQNIKSILDNFSQSKALWMFRHYKDVASSNLKHFGINNGIVDLTPMVENNKDDWRGEYVPDKAKEIILKYFSKDMNPYDAAVLFWYVRNSIYFELELESNSNIMICQYEDLVTNPQKIMNKIYNFNDLDFPGDHIIKHVHSSSLNKGKQIDISPEIEKLADEMFDKLISLYNLRK